eukprot:15472724-Alexandrium_andersonii.AAC.1
MERRSEAPSRNEAARSSEADGPPADAGGPWPSMASVGLPVPPEAAVGEASDGVAAPAPASPVASASTTSR